MNRIDNPERLNTLQRVGRQFAMVPWWAKPILALVYVAVIVGIVFLTRWLASFDWPFEAYLRETFGMAGSAAWLIAFLAILIVLGLRAGRAR